MSISKLLSRHPAVAQFNQTVWAMLSGIFVVRISYFMSWPFLIIVLNNHPSVSAMGVGIILGFSAGIAALSAVYIGYLADKFGEKPLLMTGCLVGMVCYVLLPFANSFWQYFTIMACLGLVRPLVEVVGKTIMCNQLVKPSDRETALYIRYFLINVAGAIGPLLGLWAGLRHADTLFTLTGIAYFCFCIWIYRLIDHTRPVRTETLPSFHSTLNVIRQDLLFLTLLIAIFLILIVYSQASATVPQLITALMGNDAAQLIVLLTVVNCVTVVVLQFPLLKLFKRLDISTRTQIGLLCLFASQVLFLVMDQQSILAWAAAFFVFSLAEVIVIPTISVHIDSFAKPGLRGSYFGAAAFSELGSALGPMFGALMISQFSDTHYFVATITICLILMVIYGVIRHKQTKY
ncbi:MFS transporter [Moraxella nasibovis]|uniref:MFS transporter n=1 Tax=Moraxella nasibovis TaxID=2904120 RepID=UPI0024101FAA|nr:MFS transporter [Moraxella nasibovis]WFF37935.1 MFS transporter [Moraxella nasibovis]